MNYVFSFASTGRWLGALALTVLITMTSAWAHQAAKPLRPMHGGMVAEVDDVRLELMVCPPSLELRVRNDQDVPLRLGDTQVRAWQQQGLATVPIAVQGAWATSDAAPVAERYMVTVRLDDGRSRRAMFATKNQGDCANAGAQELSSAGSAASAMIRANAVGSTLLSLNIEDRHGRNPHQETDDANNS